MKVLFLDRDGVINVEKEGSYILNPTELSYYPGALAAISAAKEAFELIIVVTNQRGIGKGLMTENDLDAIHQQINADLALFNGKIDAFYHAPALHSDDPLRKPNTGMGNLALLDFPAINFSKSVMIGNNLSDMSFGKTLGMSTVFLSTTQAPIQLPHQLIDAQYNSLAEWGQEIL